MSKEYKIETLEAMMQIPSDRFPVFLSELTEALKNTRALYDMTIAIGELHGCTKDEVMTKPPRISWVDDGRQDFSVSVKWRQPND